MELIQLCDEQGNEVGAIEKLEAHKKGVLHKAFSILIFNDKGEMLIHQRAANKYHSPNLWTNACCSHPHPNEKLIDAAHRRLQEELGFDCDLTPDFSFVYKFYDEVSGLWEHEHDTVFKGIYNDDFVFNKAEVKAIKWIDTKALQAWMGEKPEDFTFWFKVLWKEVRR